MSNLIDTEMRVVFQKQEIKVFALKIKVQLHKKFIATKIRISLKQATVEHLLNIMTNYKIRAQ